RCSRIRRNWFGSRPSCCSAKRLYPPWPGSWPSALAPPETAAVVLPGDDAEQNLAKALDSRDTGLAEGGGDPGTLYLAEPPLELAALFGQFQQTLAPVLRAAVLDDKPLADELAKYPIEALLGDPQDQQQFAHGHVRMPRDEMDDPVMGAAK